MNTDELHVVSYSPVQQCWHIESLADHVRSNARNLGAGTLGVTAYCAVALVKSREEGHCLISKIQKALRAGKAKPQKTKATGMPHARQAKHATLIIRHVRKNKREGIRHARYA